MVAGFFSAVTYSFDTEMFYHCYKKVWAPAWLMSMF